MSRRAWAHASIAGKLVRWFLVISLIPLVALLVLTQHLSQGLMRQIVVSQLQALADQKARRIESYALEHRRNLAALVQVPIIGDTLIALTGHEGRQEGPPAPEAVFRPSLTAFAEFAGYQDLLLISPDGVLVFSTGRRLPAGLRLDGPELAGSELAKVADRARTLQEPQISAFDTRLSAEGPAAFVATPVLRGGVMVGLAAVQISNQDLWRELTEHNGLGESGEVAVGIQDGPDVLIAAPLRHDPEAAFHRRLTAGSSAAGPLLAAVNGIKGQGEMVDYRGVETLAVWRYLPSFRWGLVVKIDRKEALFLVARQRQLVLGIALLTLVGVVLLALYAARSLSRPVRAMTEGVRRLGRGDLSQQVAVGTRDELGELATAFNRMTADLRDVYATIEEQVRQRTRELELSNRELARARDELRKFYQAVECSPVSVIIADPQGLIEYVNPHFTQATGYTSGEAVGRQPALAASGETPPAVHRSLWETILAGGEWRGEFLNRRKDGTAYWEAASISPVREPGGAITHFVSIQDDISVRKETEAHLRAAKEAAEEASRAKSEFLAVMSHEIRTPMNGILGMTQLMLDTPLTAGQRDYLETIRYSGEALLALLNDILDFSKLEAGRVELERADFDLPACLEQVIGLMRARAREKRLALTVAIDPAVPRHLRGDQGRLRQILLNLIGNAVKFTDRGGIHVSVEPVPGEGGADGAGRYRFSVADSGIGIAAADRERLFQSFSQADSSITRRYGGSGLGLAICRRLVELQGGEIGLDSAPGQGSVFWFILALDQGLPPAHAAAPEAFGQGALPRLRILLAEDNAVNRKVAIAILEKWGHKVTAVINGRQAVEAAGAESFDLVLMDVQMPEMDGLEAARRIRALPDPRFRRLPVIALTANAMNGDEERCHAAGMDDYLSKPIQPDRLFDALARVCRKRLAAGLPGGS